MNRAIEAHVSLLKRLARYSIYASVVLGVILLVQLYTLVPNWLFLSVLAGWIAYLIISILIARDYRIAYPLGLIIALLTLVVSLPQPEHYSLVSQGLTLPAMTFLTGSILQVLVIALVTLYLLTLRKKES